MVYVLPNSLRSPVLNREGSTFEEMVADCSVAVLVDRWSVRLNIHHPATYQHSLRVCNYLSEVAESVDFAPLTCFDVMQMGILHDVGKLAVPRELLNSKSLTVEEFERVKVHTLVGYLLLQGKFPFAACAAGKHHPAYAVSFYPSCLSVEQRKAVDRVIPLLTLCDFYDALVTRETGAFLEIDRQDQKQVRSLLNQRFFGYKDVVDVLMRHFEGR